MQWFLSICIWLVFNKLIVWDPCPLKININVANSFARYPQDIFEYELVIYRNTFATS